MNFKFNSYSTVLKKSLAIIIVVLCAFILAANKLTVSASSKYKLLIEDVSSKYTMETIEQLNKKIVSEVPNEITELDVIVKLNLSSLTSHYLESVDSSEIKSVSEYAATEGGKNYLSTMNTKIYQTIDNLKKDVRFIKVGNIYDTTIAGFSCTVNLENYLKLAASDLVSDLIISERYEVPQTNFDTVKSTNSGSFNSTYSYSTGIYDTSNANYDGSGMVIAVLDTGCDIYHPSLGTMPEVSTFDVENISEVLTSLKSYEASNNTAEASKLYVNKKVVYAYDYADDDYNVYPATSDHGLHVAGIIAGDDDVVTGSAPKAQLAIMKVFSDTSTGASSADIISALEDCVLLNVDVINMSLGSACGFTREDEDNALKINEVYEAVKDSGISLVVAAANNYSAGFGAENSNSSLITNPDSGTVGSPATYGAALSVASIDTELTPYLLANDSTPVFFRQASDSKDFYDFVEGLLGQGSSKTFEYVAIDGTGTKEDYNGLDVKGKIVLVQRGTITFEKKQKIAAEQGAIACIIYNNTSGSITMSIEKLMVPTCSISQISGNKLVETETGTITVSKSYEGGPFMSAFSSWGPSPDLNLTPEITAPGGSIYSAYRNGYTEASGTSMASPNLAGIVSIMKQYVKETFPELSKVEQVVRVNQLLMSSAEIISDENGNPYSPRKQGSGLANVMSALNTQAYITVDGSDKTKITLGDDPRREGVYTLTFNVVNTGKSSLVYTVNPYVMTEGVVPGATTETSTVAEQANMLDDSGISISIENGRLKGTNQIIVEGNSTAVVTVEIILSDEAKLHLDATFRYGMYVEGFVELISNSDNGINLSIPYLGFYGDWTEAPIMDNDIYSNYENETTSAYYETTPLGLYYNGQYLIPLGKYAYIQDDDDEQVSVSTDKAALSYMSSSIYALYSVYTGMLRNAKTINYEITDTLTGEVITSAEVTNARKSYYNNGVMPHADIFGISPYGSNLPNNRNYTFTMTALLDYGDGGINTNAKNSFSFSFYVDYEAPLLDENACEFYTEVDSNGKTHYYVDLAMYDNHYVMAYAPCSVTGNTATMLSNTFIPNYSDIRNGTTYTTLEITDYMGQLNDNTLALYLQDYALNSAIFSLTVPDDIALSFVETLDVEDETISLKKNETKELGLITLPENAWLGSLKFDFKDAEGNDANSLFATSNGSVKAYETGTYTVTITDSRNENINKTINIIVNEQDGTDAEVTFKDFSFATMLYNGTLIDYQKAFEVHPSDTIKLGLEFAPWNSDAPVITWKSGDEEVATVDENGVITFLEVHEETRVRITATVNGISHSTAFVVSSAFLVEGGQLRAYYGSEVDLVIPSNLNIFYIYPQCFANNTTLRSVVLPEDLVTINAQAFYGCTALESVTIPSGVAELYIGDAAFYRCTSLTSINLEDASTGIYIGANAFNGCTSLSNIDLSMVVNISASAFSGCTGLRSIDLSALKVCGQSAFNGCTGLVDVTFSETTATAQSMFYGCTGLLTLRLPLKNLANQMFFGCTSLTSVIFTNEVEEIGAQAFQGCTELTSVKFRESVDTIGQQAFQGCVGLTSFKLPSGLNTLAAFAFRNCTNLTSVTFSNDAVLNDVQSSVFDGCTSLERFIVTAGSKVYATDSYGVVYRLTGDVKTSVVAVPLAADLTGYTLPSTVTKIESGVFSIRKDITSIDLSNVVEIGEFAFYNTANLASVTLSDELTSIGYGAFYGTKLSSIVIPNSVEEIGDYAFANSSTEITFADPQNSKLKSIGVYAFSTMTNTTIDLPVGLESIGDRAFYNCKNLTSITLPDSCKTVGHEAFVLCESLEDVHFGAVEEVGQYVFMYSTAVKSFSAAEGATTLGEYMFSPTFTVDDWGTLVVVEMSLHNALVEVNLPASLKTIPLYCFAYCNGLTEFTSNTVTNVDPYAFTHCDGLKTVTLSAVEKLGLDEFDTYTEFSYAFSHCTNLETVNLPNATAIYEAAFYNNTSLQTVNAPKLKFAGDAAFYDCRSLTTTNFDELVTISDFAFYNCTMTSTVEYEHVTSVGVSAYYNCGNLTKVDLPSLTFMDQGAFAGCRELTELNIPLIETIGQQALLSTNLSEFEIPASLTTVGFGAFTGNYNLKEFTIAEGNEVFFVADGVLYETFTNGKVQLNSYPSGKRDERFVIYEGTARINEYAFAYNTHLKSVVLPYSMESIAARAFYRCSNLTAYEFTSYHAPVLECAMLTSSIYNMNYDNFFDLITTFDGIYMSSPANGVGYDHFIYNVYFEHNFPSQVVADDATYQVIQAIDAIGEFDEFSNRVNGLINYARNIYNRITDPVQRTLVTNYDVLVSAEEKIASLRNNRTVQATTEPANETLVEEEVKSEAVVELLEEVEESSEITYTITKVVAIVKEKNENEK